MILVFRRATDGGVVSHPDLLEGNVRATSGFRNTILIKKSVFDYHRNRQSGIVPEYCKSAPLCFSAFNHTPFPSGRKTPQMGLSFCTCIRPEAQSSSASHVYLNVGPYHLSLKLACIASLTAINIRWRSLLPAATPISFTATSGNSEGNSQGNGD